MGTCILSRTWTALQCVGRDVSHDIWMLAAPWPQAPAYSNTTSFRARNWPYCCRRVASHVGDVFMPCKYKAILEFSKPSALQTDSWHHCHKPKAGTRNNGLSRLQILALQENTATNVAGFCTRCAKMWLSWGTFLPLSSYAGLAADLPLLSERERAPGVVLFQDRSSGWECKSSESWVWPGHCWCLEPKGFAHTKAALLAPKQKGNPPKNSHKGELGMITNLTGQH